jgi:hypothetical protein
MGAKIGIGYFAEFATVTSSEAQIGTLLLLTAIPISTSFCADRRRFGRSKAGDASHTYCFRSSRLWPDISLGTGKPRSSSSVGATSARIPSIRRNSGAFAAT